jgi:hypothetical protein
MSSAGTAGEISDDDDRYIRSRFVSLDRVAERSGVPAATLRSWQHRAEFPRPAYVLPDGTEWYPFGYAELVRRATRRGVGLRDLFEEAFRAALLRIERREPAFYHALVGDAGPSTIPEAVEAHWASYLTGEYGVCLKVPWVPCILQKARLLRRLDELLEDPHPGRPAWDRALRTSVDRLDALEMPFAELDRKRFGRPVSRDTYIRRVRERFPLVFRPAASTPAPRGPAPARAPIAD